MMVSATVVEFECGKCPEIVIRNAYQEYGYVILRNLIPTALIDNLLDQYAKEIVPSKNKFYRQNTNKYDINRINSFGYVQQSFLDIHDYRNHVEFSTRARAIFGFPDLTQVVRSVSNSEQALLMQTMLFDQNAGTPPHQDWWYLDSRPSGHLLAVWIALEDIHELAGRFYLLPKSMGYHPLVPNPHIKHSEWLAQIQKIVDENQHTLHAPEMRKGDVIIWNSRTIHGSFKTIDERYSRKSLTAHYLPGEYTFGNIFKEKPYIKLQVKDGISYFRNQPDYSFVNDLKFTIRNAVYNKPRVLKILRMLQK